jgi:hypothetical protein
MWHCKVVRQKKWWSGELDHLDFLRNCITNAPSKFWDVINYRLTILHSYNIYYIILQYSIINGFQGITPKSYCKNALNFLLQITLFSYTREALCVLTLYQKAHSALHHHHWSKARSVSVCKAGTLRFRIVNILTIGHALMLSLVFPQTSHLGWINHERRT